MANTISYKDLKRWYLDNTDAKDNAARFFGDKQPTIHSTGFYSAPSWNWAYFIGICKVDTRNLNDKHLDDIIYFEVVTQFGQVVAAKRIYIPEVIA